MPIQTIIFLLLCITTMRDTWTKVGERMETRGEGGFDWGGGEGLGKMQTTVIEQQ